MHFILFEDESHQDLWPLTLTRPIFELRCGIDTLAEKWQRALGEKVFRLASGYLAAKFTRLPAGGSAVWINGKFFPTADLLDWVTKELDQQVAMVNEREEVIAFKAFVGIESQFHGPVTSADLQQAGLKIRKVDFEGKMALRRPADIFQLNGEAIRQDFEWFRANSEHQPVKDKFTAVYGADNLLVHPSASIKAAILNAENGPIYIGPGAKVEEGAIISGAHAICGGATVGMGAKLRGDTTIGPVSKAGGEIGNSVIMGYSNKGHDGYLGNSVLGYWCNLGADTNTSNLKNNYTEVRLWNYKTGRFAPTGSIFCGLIMGDHSKCGINTMFNTGTVVGVSANIFGAGYPRNFIPSFSWGGAAGLSTYQFAKAMEVAEVVMGRRKLELEADEREILQEVFEMTAKYRNWEKK